MLTQLLDELKTGNLPPTAISTIHGTKRVVAIDDALSSVDWVFLEGEEVEPNGEIVTDDVYRAAVATFADAQKVVTQSLEVLNILKHGVRVNTSDGEGHYKALSADDLKWNTVNNSWSGTRRVQFRHNGGRILQKGGPGSQSTHMEALLDYSAEIAFNLAPMKRAHKLWQKDHKVMVGNIRGQVAEANGYLNQVDTYSESLGALRTELTSAMESPLGEHWYQGIIERIPGMRSMQKGKFGMEAIPKDKQLTNLIEKLTQSTTGRASLMAKARSLSQYLTGVIVAEKEKVSERKAKLTDADLTNDPDSNSVSISVANLSDRVGGYPEADLGQDASASKGDALLLTALSVTQAVLPYVEQSNTYHRKLGEFEQALKQGKFSGVRVASAEQIANGITRTIEPLEEAAPALHAKFARYIPDDNSSRVLETAYHEGCQSLGRSVKAYLSMTKVERGNLVDTLNEVEETYQGVDAALNFSLPGAELRPGAGAFTEADKLKLGDFKKVLNDARQAIGKWDRMDIPQTMQDFRSSVNRASRYEVDWGINDPDTKQAIRNARRVFDSLPTADQVPIDPRVAGMFKAWGSLHVEQTLISKLEGLESASAAYRPAARESSGVNNDFWRRF
jgi:hypothetical protein